MDCRSLMYWEIWLGRLARRLYIVFFFQAEDGIRDLTVTGVQTCALPISDPLAHVAREEERGPLLFGSHRATSGPLVSLEVLEDIELHTLPPDRIDGQTTD